MLVCTDPVDLNECKFNAKWLENSKYLCWLRPVSANDSEAHCTLCHKTFKLCTLEIKAVESRKMGKRHRSYAKASQFSIADFCLQVYTGKPILSSPSALRELSHLSSAAASDICLVCAQMLIPRAEVIWVLRTVKNPFLYGSKDGINYVFKAMFSDSDLLQTFPCKRHKTAYMAGFGLAPYIGTLVVIFNESLNQMAKTKQLDILVCYWIKFRHIMGRSSQAIQMLRTYFSKFNYFSTIFSVPPFFSIQNVNLVICLLKNYSLIFLFVFRSVKVSALAINNSCYFCKFVVK